MLNAFFYTLCGLSIALAVFVAFFQLKKSFYAKYLVKCLASLCFVFAAVVAFAKNSGTLQGWHFGVFVGIILGFVGDILICVDHFENKKGAEIVKLTAMGAFLLGHIAYIVAFCVYAVNFNFYTLMWAVAAPVLMFLLIRFKVIKPGRASIPIIVYALVLGLMGSAAINLLLTGKKAAEILFIGAALFTVSDFLLAFQYYGKPNKIIAYIYIIAYYIAQSVIVFGIL